MFTDYRIETASICVLHHNVHLITPILVNIFKLDNIRVIKLLQNAVFILGFIFLFLVHLSHVD